MTPDRTVCPPPRYSFLFDFQTPTFFFFAMAAPMAVPPPKVLDRTKVEPTAERIKSWTDRIRDAAPHLAATEVLKNKIKWVHAKFEKCGTRAFLAAIGPDGVPIKKVDPDAWGAPAFMVIMPPAQVAWASTEPHRQVRGNNPEATPQFCIKFMQPSDKRYRPELNEDFQMIGKQLEEIINIGRCK